MTNYASRTSALNYSETGEYLIPLFTGNVVGIGQDGTITVYCPDPTKVTVVAKDVNTPNRDIDGRCFHNGLFATSEHLDEKHFCGHCGQWIPNRDL